MKSLFITGAAGALGQTLLENLTDDVQIIALEHKRPVPPRPNQTIVKGSLETLSTHTSLIENCSHILHLAACTHAPQPDHYFKANTEGTKCLLKNCHPGQHFIYISSRCNDPSGGAYSHSKHLAEQAVISSGIPFSIIQPAEVYGSKEGEGIDSLFALALRHRLILDLVAGPSITFSPISATEVSSFILTLLHHFKAENKTYTLCADKPYSIRDLQKVLSEALEKKIYRIPFPYPLMRMLLALPIPLPVQPDQLARLVAPKAKNNSNARETGMFKPEPLITHLKGLANQR